jgi:hypothetical protein
VDKLKELIGCIPNDNKIFKRRMRMHQAWWRAFVLGEEQGQHRNDKNGRLCNTPQNVSKRGLRRAVLPEAATRDRQWCVGATLRST